MDREGSRGGFKLSCIACQLLASLVLTLPNGNSREEVAQSAVGLCVTILGQQETMCRGIIDGNLEVLFDLKEQGMPITPERICGTVLENENCSVKSGPQVDWRLEVDMGRKLEQSDSSESRYSPDDGEVSIVQITDIHFDPEYTAGRTATCLEPLCCRSYQPNATSEADRATRYGHYNYCDMPLDAVRSALDDIRKNKKVSMIYMTGDLVAHAVWETSRTKNLEVVKTIAELFREYLGDIPVIPIVGNHETHPVNVFAPYFIQGPTSSAWLYKGFIEHWGWSLPEQAKQTFLKGGYYSFLAQDKLRIVVINTNIYQKLNWWNVLFPVDMNDQLTWLATTLLDAESKKEKVHILSHIPPGSEDTLQVFQREYRNIIDRFEQTISAEFNGHTHYEDFTLFYDKHNSSRAHSVAFNGGSITSFNNVNPNYRVYRINARTWEVNDYDSFSYNISDIRDDSSPEWRKLYSFREEYRVNSLSPQDLSSLATRMMDDSELFNKYFYNYLKGSAKESYDSKRKTKILCDIMTSEKADTTHCNLLRKLTEKKRALRSIGAEFVREIRRRKR